MITTYEKYLEIIHERMLEKFFNQQKDYVFCKSGCSFCCEKGQYPFSELEFKYVMIGYNNLNDETKLLILDKVKKVKEQQIGTNNEEFAYECPFLIDKMCSIYDYRGIICRTHGLMFYYQDENGESKSKAPKCISIGLNYSNVYDEKSKTISSEMWEKSGIEAEPISYNLSLKFLLNNVLTKQLELDFGEEKTLIDWFN